MEQIILSADMADMPKDYPKLDAWLKRMSSRESVVKVIGDRSTRVPGAPGAKPAPGT